MPFYYVVICGVVFLISASETTPEGETALFLSGQEMMWKGFINMHSVAKFVTKAYMVSGSFEHIKEVCFLRIKLS